jgi:adenosylhomocysteinase
VSFFLFLQIFYFKQKPNLQEEGITVCGQRSDGREEHESIIHSLLQRKPQLLMDNGAELTRTLIQHYGVEGLIGCTEKTTTGANLLREELKSQSRVSIIVINDSGLKQIIENEHGVGQTIVEGFMRTMDLLYNRYRSCMWSNNISA